MPSAEKPVRYGLRLGWLPPPDSARAVRVEAATFDMISGTLCVLGDGAEALMKLCAPSYGRLPGNFAQAPRVHHCVPVGYQGVGSVCPKQTDRTPRDRADRTARTGRTANEIGRAHV